MNHMKSVEKQSDVEQAEGLEAFKKGRRVSNQIILYLMLIRLLKLMSPHVSEVA